MATQYILHIPDELLPGLQTKAQSEGKTVDEIAVKTLRNRLDDSPWQALLAYGLERGRESEYTEEDVSRLVRENRHQHR